MKIKILFYFFIVFFPLSGCKKYLDLKPDKSLVVPASLSDCQALLNNTRIVASLPTDAEIATTDFNLTEDVFNYLTLDERNVYSWKSDAQLTFGSWIQPYRIIIVANQVLETLENISPSDEWKRIKGSALLLRSVTFLHLTTHFTQPYDPSTSNSDLGIPLKKGVSIDEQVSRGTLQQTYNQIVTDLNEAVSLLPSQEPSSPATRSMAMPTKAAAYAALARTYLIMGDYSKAHEAADASLGLYDQLSDFNTIQPSPYPSFSRFNTEVLYELSGSSIVSAYFGRVSSELFGLYEDGDLRKSLYFSTNPDNTVSFIGSYFPYQSFCGYATNEMYLVRAECAARAGNTAAALLDLNALRKKRWDNDDPQHPYADLAATNAEDALKLVIRERRKELPYTTLRWVDLRRLNKDPRFAVTLTRTIGNQTYTLPPKDLRYTFLIPREVLQRTTFEQNPR